MSLLYFYLHKKTKQKKTATAMIEGEHAKGHNDALFQTLWRSLEII